MSKAMLLVMLVVVLALAAPAFAASDITVTVTLGQLGVDVTPASWALGLIPPTVAKSSWSSGTPGYFTATNAGNAEADIMISAGATSPSGWQPTPGAYPDTNAYIIAFGIGTPPYNLEPTYTGFSNTPAPVAENIAIGGAVSFDLRFTAPTAASTYDPGGETFAVTLSATTL